MRTKIIILRFRMTENISSRIFIRRLTMTKVWFIRDSGGLKISLWRILIMSGMKISDVFVWQKMAKICFWLIGKTQLFSWVLKSRRLWSFGLKIIRSLGLTRWCMFIQKTIFSSFWVCMGTSISFQSREGLWLKSGGRLLLVRQLVSIFNCRSNFIFE